jgi:hypothetical protein
MNPKESNLTAELKIHKPMTLIKLVINNSSAPSRNWQNY